MIALFLLFTKFISTEGCTLIAAGKLATSDGSVIVAHTDDAGGGTGDLRLVRVPAADWPKGSKRPVYNFNNGFPRLVDEKRSPLYSPQESEGAKPMKPMGYIPQVEHTYAYYDQDYALMNEVQLSVAESTCGARTAGWPLSLPYGKNLFSIAELSKVALERCDSARCAIQTMGDLAVEYGFYDEDSGSPARPLYSDTAEVLAIGDRYGEVWIFHVLTAPDGGSAIWAAQRVPDDHIATAPNRFIIREMNLDDKDNFMASANIHSAAIEMGWWNPKDGKPFDFTAAYGYVTRGPVMPMYSGRRSWRIFDLAAPSLKLSPYLGAVPYPATYPFSVKPDNLLSLEWFFHILRDHYEGTEFDMTKGMMAGPFGNPLRYEGPSHNVSGGFERAISIFRTTFSFVAQSRPWLPNEIGGLFWYAQDAPHGSIYVPFYGSQANLPKSYVTGKQSVFNRECAWWAFNFLNQILNIKYNYMIREVQNTSFKFENKAILLTKDIEAHVYRLNDTKDALKYIEEKTNKHAEEMVEKWWRLSEYLVAKYSNGYITTGETGWDQDSPGYPEFWLRNTEFATWPPGPKWVDYPNTPPSTAPVPVIPDTAKGPGHYKPAFFNLAELRAGQTNSYQLASHATATFMTYLTILIMGGVFGVLGTLQYLKYREKRWEYITLPTSKVRS